MGCFHSRESVYEQKGAPPKQEETVQHLPPIHNGPVLSLSRSAPGATQFISGSEDKTIVLYDWSQKKVIERWQGHEGDINVLVQGNDLIFSGSRDKTVRIWKRGSSEALRVLKGHEMNVTALDCFFTDTGAIQGSLVSGSRDATVRLWDIETGTAIGSKRIYRNLVTGLCALRDDMNQTFVQISEDLTIRTWDIRSMDVVNSIAGLINIPTCVDVSKDPNIFMIGSKGFNNDGCSVTVWDRRKNQIIRTFEGHSQTINACAFLSNNNYVVSAGNDRSIKVWDINDGNCVHTITTDDFGGPPMSICATQTNSTVSFYTAGLLDHVGGWRVLDATDTYPQVDKMQKFERIALEYYCKFDETAVCLIPN